MRRTLRIALTVAAVAYGGLCAALYFCQDSLIYLPPARAQNPEDPTIAMTVEGVRLLVSVRPGAGPGALLYFGGNAEDVSLTLPSFARALPEHALYLLHYRGYAGSAGSPSEADNRRDALALFDRVRQEHASVAVVGRSLGTGVAVQLASERPVYRLVLITPFDSLEEIAARQFPLFPVRLLLRDKYDSWQRAPAIATPTTILMAEHDEVVPRASTERLFARFAAGVASLKIVPGANHNSISSRPEYLGELRSALE